MRIAVVGAGLSGVLAALRLAAAGCEVQVFDGARSVGGRMASQAVEWRDERGESNQWRFDLGVPAFTARTAAFQGAVEAAERQGVLARWQPVAAPGGFEALDQAALWVPVPTMGAWCEQLAAALPVRLGAPIDALEHAGGRWMLASGGERLPEDFSHVMLAVPPQQAAALLRGHRDDWAAQALHWPMRPCWALMAVVRHFGQAPSWQSARPVRGPLAWIVRDDAKPGRPPLPGRAAWVAQATADWSQTHLEAPEAAVRAALVDALQHWLGPDVAWEGTWVHRWRDASAVRSASGGTPCWFDRDLGLGVCGDFLGGAAVEGAFTSGEALAALVLSTVAPTGSG